MKPVLLFSHGWAFDRHVWGPLRERLGQWEHLFDDAGYFDEARPVPGHDGPVVVIGHSYGFMRRLADMPQGCVGAVSINGFARFASTGPGAPGTPAKVLDRMIARLRQDPSSVVDQFRERCGAGSLQATSFGATLQTDLEALRHDDQSGRLAELRVPLLALAGRQDAIVPESLTMATFSANPGQELHWKEDGGHLLPVTDPDWCAERIVDWLARIASAA